MAKYITKKTFLELLAKKGIRMTYMTLWAYQRDGIFSPSYEIKYGGKSLPFYLEEDVDKLRQIVIQRFKTRKTKDKRIFINGVPKSLASYTPPKRIRRKNVQIQSE